MNTELPGLHLSQRMAHGAGRDVIRELCGQLVEQARPDERDGSMFVINALIDRVAAGDPAAAGDDREFGLGSGELLAMALVPALAELLGQLAEAGRQPEDPVAAARESIAAWSARTGVRVTSAELALLAQAAATLLGRAGLADTLGG